MFLLWSCPLYLDPAKRYSTGKTHTHTPTGTAEAHKVGSEGVSILHEPCEAGGASEALSGTVHSASVGRKELSGRVLIVRGNEEREAWHASKRNTCVRKK